MLQGVSLLDNLQPGMQDLTYKCNGKVKVGRNKTNQWNQKSRKMSQLKTNTGELCVIFQLGTQNRLQRGEFEWGECAQNLTFEKSAFKS